MSKVFLVMPAYNEEKTIAKVIKDVEPYVDKILIVNDGSEDKTLEKIKSKKAIVVSHAINLGHGAARETGFEFARHYDADIVVTYDADDQFVAKDITKIIKPINDGEADVVLGSRFMGKTVNMPITRYLILKMGILFTFLFSGVMLTDTHVGLRAFNKKALSKIRLTQNGAAYASEIIDQSQKHKLRIVEVPVTIKYSKYTLKHGQSNSAALNIFMNLVADRLK